MFCANTLSSHYHRRHLYSLILTLSMGTNGAFLTGDLFNLYVWFEVLLLSSFALMAMIRGEKGRAAAWRYIVINLISSLLFLTAAGLIYGKTGTLNNPPFDQDPPAVKALSGFLPVDGGGAIGGSRGGGGLSSPGP